MIIANHKAIRIIGYAESSMTQEFVSEITKTHKAEIITPEQFADLDDPDQYQYIIAVWKSALRKLVINQVDSQNLDLITVIHDSVVLGNSPAPVIGAGSFVFAFCSVMISASIGRHCILGAHCHIGHFCNLGDNCQLRPGVMLSGKSKIGNNCLLNTKCCVTNKSVVGDNVELLAFTNVIKDLPDPGIYVGSSAKKFNQLTSPNSD